MTEDANKICVEGLKIGGVTEKVTHMLTGNKEMK